MFAKCFFTVSKLYSIVGHYTARNRRASKVYFFVASNKKKKHMT